MWDHRKGLHPVIILCALVPCHAEELDEIIVSSTADEPSASAATYRSFDEETFDAPVPRQLTDFFRNNALGMVQEVSVAHSAVNLRGAGTLGAGQAWSDAAEIQILINGRSSGTANLGKISLHDIDAIEVIRGPSSVLHGSSALGGVINLKTKDATVFQGTELTSIFSSFNRFSEIVQHGGKQGKLDYYLELSATASGDYDTGRGSPGHQPNTDYKQRSANLTLGYEINDRDRLEFMFRHDGIYHAGHPGATYSLSDHDDRYGTSLELTYSGSTTDGRFHWKNQTWYNRDVDELHWSQDPLIG
ncbi:MAG TPA: TonB-dependent receptor plug domain-containing protein, partial [Luteolibacter sp.]|nr:TonB-dependent receptor plug domain-containing protein [Luteolibacter sp.]